jgi:phosphatidylglycerol:prolipoprotein diacylglycerol transferase
MYQTLFHIPNQVGGVPVFGFGILLAAWVAFSVGLVAWLVWRQGLCADTLSYLPLLAVVAAVIWLVLPNITDDYGLPIRGYGVMILTAMVAGTGLVAWRAWRVGIDPDLAVSLCMWIAIPGAIGARAFYVAEYWSVDYWPVYQQSGLRAFLWALVDLSRGGLVIYGALAGALTGMLLFVRNYRVSFLAVVDLVAPALMLGLAFGRIGCLLNGCCFGGACERPWAVTFPAGSPPYQSQVARGQMYGFQLGKTSDGPAVVQLVEAGSAAERAGLKAGDRIEAINDQRTATAGAAGYALRLAFEKHRPLVLKRAEGPAVSLPAAAVPARSLPVHPTQVYSSINAFLLCLLLLAYDPFKRRDGELFALLLVVYPIARFLLEMIRTDEPPISFTGLTIAQNVSLALLLCGVGLWLYLLRRPAARAFGPTAAV